MLVLNGLERSTLEELRATGVRNGRCLDAEIGSILTAHVRAQKGPSTMTLVDERITGNHSCGEEIAPSPDMLRSRESASESAAAPGVRGGAIRSAASLQDGVPTNDKHMHVSPMSYGLRMLLGITSGRGGAGG